MPSLALPPSPLRPVAEVDDADVRAALLSPSEHGAPLCSALATLSLSVAAQESEVAGGTVSDRLAFQAQQDQAATLALGWLRVAQALQREER